MNTQGIRVGDRVRLVKTPDGFDYPREGTVETVDLSKDGVLVRHHEPMPGYAGVFGWAFHEVELVRERGDGLPWDGWPLGAPDEE